MNKPENLKQLIQNYLCSPDWDVLSPASVESYTKKNKVLLTHFSDNEVFYEYTTKVNEQANVIFKTLKDASLSNYSRNLIRAHIHVLYKWANINHNVPPECDPYRFLPLLRHEPREGNPFTPKEVSKVVDLLTTKDMRGRKLLSETEELIVWFIKFLFETGMRPGEAINLKPTDVVSDSEGDLIQIVGAKFRERNKVSRYIQVTDAVEECVSQSLRLRISRKTLHSDTLFVTEQGRKLSQVNIRTVFNRIMNKVGLEGKQPYDLRRGTATEIIHNPDYGVSVAQKQLGHKNIATTMSYERLNKKAAARLFNGHKQKEVA